MISQGRGSHRLKPALVKFHGHRKPSFLSWRNGESRLHLSIGTEEVHISLDIRSFMD
jgi:hypothetical protein